MASQMLRDRQGRRIGEIEVRSNGSMIGFDSRGMRVGEYNPRTNSTTDETGMRIGEGNLLSFLIASKF